jgi:hypothetical protein
MHNSLEMFSCNVFCGSALYYGFNFGLIVEVFKIMASIDG